MSEGGGKVRGSTVSTFLRGENVREGGKVSE